MTSTDLTIVNYLAFKINHYIENAKRGRHKHGNIREGDIKEIGFDIAKLIDGWLNGERSNDDPSGKDLFEDELSQLTFELTKFIDSRIAAVERV